MAVWTVVSLAEQKAALMVELMDEMTVDAMVDAMVALLAY